MSEKTKNKEDNGLQLKKDTESNQEQLKKSDEIDESDQKNSKKQKKKHSSESRSKSKSRSKHRSKSRKSKKDRDREKRKKHRSSSSSRSKSSRRHRKRRRSKSRSRRDKKRISRSKSFSSKKSDKKMRRDKFQWDSPPKDEKEIKQEKIVQQETNTMANPLGLGLQGLGLMQIPNSQAAVATSAMGQLNPLNPMNQQQDMLQKMQLVQMMKNLQSQNANSDKKLYIGNLPPNITPQTLCDVLNSALQKMNVNTNPGNSVVNSWISPDGHYGFVEFRTPEETTNGFALNNVAIFGQPLKVGRPRTYQQTGMPGNTMAPSLNPMGGMPGIPGLGSIPGLGIPGATNPLLAQANPLGLGLGIGGGLGGASLGGLTGLSQPGMMQNSMGLGQQVFEQSVPTIQKIQPPSRILVLKNMVSIQELEIDEEYNDILEEVKEECEKYGKVLSVKIPRPAPQKLVSGLGKVFVEFLSIDQAKEARKNLSGRTFGDNTVECSYHDEKFYAQENFNDIAG